MTGSGQSHQKPYEIPSAKRSARMMEILGVVGTRGEVALSELATMLGASAATIRRDVSALAEQHLLTRTHGGVRSLEMDSELPIRLRDARNRAAKRAIGAAAAAQLPTGRHAIALTGGSTTIEVLRALQHRRDLTVLTNSLSIGLQAAEQGKSRVLIAGGVLRPNSQELVGSLAENTFRQVNVGTVIVGCDGVSANGGLTTHDDVEARTNQVMIAKSQRLIVVADGSKVGRVMLARLADAHEIDVLVTDCSADDNEVRRLRALGVDVVVVNPEAPTGGRGNPGH